MRTIEIPGKNGRVRKRLEVICIICGKPFLVFPCKASAKICSKKCFAAHTGNRFSKHREGRTRLYQIWAAMKARCVRKNAADSHLYADRGIAVCEEWRDSYEAFRDWAAASGYTDSLSIDRIDSDKGYSPDNCRWATPAQQCQNTRKRGVKCASKFKGVTKYGKSKWKSQIQINGSPVCLGVFESEEEAARAYDKQATLSFGEFARLNFPSEVS